MHSIPRTKKRRAFRPQPAASGSTPERLAWALEAFGRTGLRLTRSRERVLRCLAAQRLPASVDALAEVPELKTRCDRTTIWRALVLLAQVQLVREVGLHTRSKHYILNAPGEQCDYLMCRECGSLDELSVPDSVRTLEQQVAESRKFTAVSHELEIYGTCPKCRDGQRLSKRSTS